MLVNQFTGMYGSLVDQGFRFFPGVIQNSFLIINNFLIAFDFIGGFHPKFPKQLFQLFLIHNDFAVGKGLVFTAVDIFFNFVN